MDQILVLYALHAFWFWLSLAALLLAVEATLGSGWLLWPAVAAGAVAALALSPLDLPPAADVGLFAAVTLALTLVSRLLPRKAVDGQDINDSRRRVIGDTGSVVVSFERGAGRVRVAGAEWPAEADADYPAGTRVVVEAVIGTRLKVRGA